MYDFRKEDLDKYFVGVQLEGVNDDEEFLSKAIDFWNDQSKHIL